jgi:uncharacterized protein (TIGR00369 family)
MFASIDLLKGFLDQVPHNQALGIVVTEVADGRVTMRLPWAEHLVGDPSTGALHGGAITALIDGCCGAAVFTALQTPMPIATLDLRIDYLKAGGEGRDVVALGHCYKVTSNVAFVRCEVAHADDPSDVIAFGAGSFMLATKRGTHRPEGG